MNDAADKLMSISVGGNTVRSFTYDGRGRRKTEWNSGNTTVYSWDAESRLVGLTKPGLTTSYGYNGLDARTSRTVGASTTTYKRAGAYVTDPVLSETTGQFSANYTPGVSERRAGVSTFLHSGLKNADARTTDGSAVTADRQYDAFGNLTGGNGTWNGPFGYAGAFGYQEDGESGLMLLGHRYYDSTTGRFLSKDPIGDGRNWYGYCGNNPLSSADPTGLWRAVIAVGAHSWAETLAVSAAIRAWTMWLKKLGATTIDVVRPTEEELANLLSDDSVEGFVFIGHGADSVAEYGGSPLKGGGSFDANLINVIASRRKKRMRVAHIWACHSAGLSTALLAMAEMSLTWSTSVGYRSLFSEPDVAVAGPSPVSRKHLDAMKRIHQPKKAPTPKRKGGKKSYGF